MKSDSAIVDIQPLGFPWHTQDPFLFCVHHDDAYPKGNAQLGPAASLAGRRLGMDFEGKDGWRMYHGEVVPGFPQHPHRGFETVTIVKRGIIDHCDSLGAAARFGHGDVQWLTAGEGIVHSEMFPLLNSEHDNPLELFQIWLNLPSKNKLVPAHFSMLWRDSIATHVARDERGLSTEVRVVAGNIDHRRGPPPPPKSWAAEPGSDVAIWCISMEAGARWSLPPAMPGTNRTLYYFRGNQLTINHTQLASGHGVALVADRSVELANADGQGEALLLQGRPIGQPVAHHGPFVMNTQEQLQQAILDYRRTGFGGWPWPSDGPVHPKGSGRFARHADGRTEHVDQGQPGEVAQPFNTEL